MDKAELLLAEAQEAFRTEAARTDRLNGRAEKQLAVAGLIVAAHLLDLGAGVSATASFYERVLTGIAVVALILSIGVTLWAMRTQPYKAQAGRDRFETLTPDSVSREEAVAAVLKMYLEAREGNRVINDRRASQIGLAGWTITVAFVAAASFRLVQVWR